MLTILLIIMAIGLVSVGVLLEWEFPDAPHFALMSAVTYSSILCAFVGIAVSIMIVGQAPVIHVIRSTQKFQRQFVRILAGTFLSGLAFAVYSLLLLAFGIPELSSMVFPLWLALGAGSVAHILSLLALMLMVFSSHGNRLHGNAP